MQVATVCIYSSSKQQQSAKLHQQLQQVGKDTNSKRASSKQESSSK